MFKQASIDDRLVRQSFLDAGRTSAVFPALECIGLGDMVGALILQVFCTYSKDRTKFEQFVQ